MRFKRRRLIWKTQLYHRLHIPYSASAIFCSSVSLRISTLPSRYSKFRFEDLYGNPKGTKQGIFFDFKFPELNGTLYYGFINYGDGKFPQPVFYQRAIFCVTFIGRTRLETI